jgi:hypothetical protein
MWCDSAAEQHAPAAVETLGQLECFLEGAGSMGSYRINGRGEQAPATAVQ